MYLPQKTTNFYLTRLRMFHNPSQIADMIGVSRITVDHWLNGDNRPMQTYYQPMKKAFAIMCDRLGGVEDIGEDIVEILRRDEPRWKPAEGGLAHTDQVRSWLRRRLSNGKWVRYKVLISEALDRGYTRNQLDYASMKLRVIKRASGRGRAAYTDWKMR